MLPTLKNYLIKKIVVVFIIKIVFFTLIYYCCYKNYQIKIDNNVVQKRIFM